MLTLRQEPFDENYCIVSMVPVKSTLTFIRSVSMKFKRLSYFLLILPLMNQLTERIASIVFDAVLWLEVHRYRDCR